MALFYDTILKLEMPILAITETTIGGNLGINTFIVGSKVDINTGFSMRITKNSA